MAYLHSVLSRSLSFNLVSQSSIVKTKLGADVPHYTVDIVAQKIANNVAGGKMCKEEKEHRPAY